MAKYTGASATFQFNSSAWSANQLVSVEISESSNTADATGISDTWEDHIPTTKNAQITVNGFDDSAKATVLDKLAVGTNGTFTFNPKGAGTGNTTITGSGTVTALSLSANNNEVVTFTATILVDGTLTTGAL